MSVILPPEPPAFVETDVAARLDAIVDRATTAAGAFRDLDQETVDEIVHAMVVAGVRHGRTSGAPVRPMMRTPRRRSSA